MLKLPEAEGMYLSFAGLDAGPARQAGGVGGQAPRRVPRRSTARTRRGYALYGAAATQVILAAIAKSDGTRKGVNDAVLSGAGITIPADQSVLGKEIIIDPTSGDTNAKDLTIEVVKDNRETFEKTQTIS